MEKVFADGQAIGSLRESISSSHEKREEKFVEPPKLPLGIPGEEVKDHSGRKLRVWSTEDDPPAREREVVSPPPVPLIVLPKRDRIGENREYE
jgi:hypothetical protein